ncbi:MAG: class I lanthipeptide [Candidatus Aminicenantes bacterium]|nr:MAG: class I lanthipeptide [Candidatus Aminicenantes bacterium]
MKKKALTSKLDLNKETIAHLNSLEMSASRGGAKETRIGRSCYTDRCCRSNHCEEMVLLPNQ